MFAYVAAIVLRSKRIIQLAGHSTESDHTSEYLKDDSQSIAGSPKHVTLQLPPIETHSASLKDGILPAPMRTRDSDSLARS